jgi:hypothetical protein
VQWNELHDATLLHLTANWQKGEVRVALRALGSRLVTIVAANMTLLNWPRLQPWGESASVNEVRVQTANDPRRLEIEMQSGDVIVIEAGRLELQEDGD